MKERLVRCGIAVKGEQNVVLKGSVKSTASRISTRAGSCASTPTISLMGKLPLSDRRDRAFVNTMFRHKGRRGE